MARVLVVDDSVDMLEMLAEVLLREGHQVEKASNGAEALKFFDDGHEFDVVLSDLIMPVLDGFGLMKELSRRGIVVPVIILSGGGVTMDSAEALRVVENMAFSVLKKPIKCEVLFEQINHAMA